MIKQSWYLIEHDELVKLIREYSGYLDTDSWCKKSGYSINCPNRKVIGALIDYKI
ncbi:hypothetical protein [Francisella sp. 19X1-34]|uniref:hypothetical protein n=1 Tax=Francisella sp. 19X1-34 TaxID=3087177 RepID=UPI002E330CCA|nr:hypothetical protein [Francisella sp. 19X1-34]MED7788399.1 hypothetical protein [Francisella sp. 19X1-34]